MTAQQSQNNSWTIIGQDRILRYLETAVKSEQLVSSYLFWGPRQTGKSAGARYFSRLLLCTQPTNNHACGVCASCTEFDRGLHPDFHLLARDDGALGIGAVRELLEQFSFRPTHGTHRVAILENAERLTNEAANALLKTLEEPPAGAVLILTTGSKDQLPATVLSRCQALEFQLVDEKTIALALERSGASQADAASLSRLAQGHPGKARQLFENPEEHAFETEKVSTFLSLLTESAGKRLESIDALLRPARERLTQEQFHELVQTWIELLRDAVLLTTQTPELLVHWSFHKEIELLRSKHSLAELRLLLDQLLDVQRLARMNVNTTLLVENFLLHA